MCFNTHDTKTFVQCSICLTALAEYGLVILLQSHRQTECTLDDIIYRTLLPNSSNYIPTAFGSFMPLIFCFKSHYNHVVKEMYLYVCVYVCVCVCVRVRVRVHVCARKFVDTYEHMFLCMHAIQVGWQFCVCM